ncbi:MAG: hypothetical protein OEV44_06030, partial [Spirochaetota bacterium]|nr:hypothetical protein [Spirochaetota bacterium]
IIKRIKNGDRNVFRIIVWDTYLWIHDEIKMRTSPISSVDRKSPLFTRKSLNAYIGGLESYDYRIRLRCMYHIINQIDRHKPWHINLHNITDLEDIDFSGLAIRDSSLSYLKDFKKLRMLNLQDTEITDIGLANLKNLNKLEKLNISNTKVNGDGFVHLKELKNLEELNLSYNYFKNGFKYLELLKKLKSLNLEAIDLEVKELGNRDPFLDEDRIIVVDKELKFLENLKSIESLSLNGMYVNGECLAYLKGLSDLNRLSLSGSMLESKFLVHLKGIKNLKKLDISLTKVDDDGIIHLNTLKGLKILDLRGSKLSAEGVKRLKKTLTNCYIKE